MSGSWRRLPVRCLAAIKALRRRLGRWRAAGAGVSDTDTPGADVSDTPEAEVCYTLACFFFRTSPPSHHLTSPSLHIPTALPGNHVLRVSTLYDRARRTDQNTPYGLFIITRFLD